MWIVEICADTSPTAPATATKYVIGPVVTVGRKPECDISFPTDKSVSRNHAEIRLDATGKLHVVDLSSKFCTYLISGKVKTRVMPAAPASTGGATSGTNATATAAASATHGTLPNSSARGATGTGEGSGLNTGLVPLSHGDTVQIGACASRIKIRRVHYAFCPTKLEKHEKEPLRRCAKYLNGKVVTNTAACSHVIAGKFAATVKILEAIVMQRPLVTLAWVVDTCVAIRKCINPNDDCLQHLAATAESLQDGQSWAFPVKADASVVLPGASALCTVLDTER